MQSLECQNRTAGLSWTPLLGYCIDMSIRLFSLLIVVIATGASSLAEELPATEVTRIVRHLMELAWGEELSRIRYMDTVPSGGSQSVVTKLIEVQGQNKRWEIVETDKDRVKTMVIGANAQYAFYAEQPAIGEPWKLMDFLLEGQTPKRGTGIKYALEREIRTIHRIPYGSSTKVMNADFLERFDVRATRDAKTKTITLHAELRPGATLDPKNPRTNVELVLDQESHAIRLYKITGDRGLLVTGTVDLMETAGKNDTPIGYRWTQETQTGTNANSIRLRKTGIAAFAVYDDREIEREAFYLEHYGIQVPESKDER